MTYHHLKSRARHPAIERVDGNVIEKMVITQVVTVVKFPFLIKYIFLEHACSIKRYFDLKKETFLNHDLKS